MEKGKVSIIIPVYNCSKYLEKCLASIALQSYKNIEIILIDDGSKDGSTKICTDFALKDSRVVLKTLDKNIGAGLTRNIGIDCSTGEYLMFIDSDDFTENNMVEKLVNVQIANSSDLVIGSYRTIEEERRVENRVFPSQIISGRNNISKMFSENFPDGYVGYLWNKLYKKSILIENNIRFTDMNRLEDATFNIEYFSKIDSCNVISDILYNYRKSTQSETIRKVPDNYVDLIERVYIEFVSYQNSVGQNYLRRISQFYYSEIGTYIENSVYSKRPHLFSTLSSLRKRMRKLDVPMYENINLYRKLLVWLLMHRLYICLYALVFIKVEMKKKHSNIFFRIKDRLH